MNKPAVPSLAGASARRLLALAATLTDSASDTAALAPIPVRAGTLRTTLPPRSLVTFVLP